AFGPAQTRSAAHALLFFSFGLFAQAGIQILTQVFYSLKDTVTLVWVGALTVAINTLFSLAFLHYTSLGHGGLALAFSLANIINLLALWWRLRARLGPMQGQRTLRTVTLAAVASMVMGWSTAWAADWIGLHLDLSSTAGRLLHVAVGTAVGCLVYGAATYVLRMEELSLIRQLARRRG
ncbi:MAG TPA: lipid II flippase MurJ, partial [Limnochordia bacterium]